MIPKQREEAAIGRIIEKNTEWDWVHTEEAAAEIRRYMKRRERRRKGE